MGNQRKVKEDPNVAAINAGKEIIFQNDVFNILLGKCHIGIDKTILGKKAAAYSRSDGTILVNGRMRMAPGQWAFVISHCMLHNCFGHYDMEKVPGYLVEEVPGIKVKKPSINRQIWNTACDIYVDKFLNDIGFGTSICQSPMGFIPGNVLEDEQRIYDYLISAHWSEEDHSYGVGALDSMDMIGLEKPIVYGKDRWGQEERNEFADTFARSLSWSVTSAIHKAAGEIKKSSFGNKIASWFINVFPLLGALAASFEIIDDPEICRQYDISVAAVDAWEGKIYINSDKRYHDEEWRFIMAHEFLHASLLHHRRCNCRDPYLWNIATDYVINGWLREMQVGSMPVDALYDPGLKDKSAEEIYDIIINDIRKFKKLDTFRGNGQSDILGPTRIGIPTDGVSLDDFYRNALSQGLEYELGRGRGTIPAGLVQEIRALAVPPVPWDVKLAEWFDVHIKPVEKHRSYAHPSRRQSSTPDIPRPKYIVSDSQENARTFGVVIDTSGSMSTEDIGKALGAVASYAAAKEVTAARVIFCDACAYDAGFLSPDDIAGRVKVVGRGGTRLQPAVDLLQSAKDFPKDGPILVITDGEIENNLVIKREHAYILPMGGRLPFRAKGETFYI